MIDRRRKQKNKCKQINKIECKAWNGIEFEFEDETVSSWVDRCNSRAMPNGGCAIHTRDLDKNYHATFNPILMSYTYYHKNANTTPLYTLLCDRSTFAHQLIEKKKMKIKELCCNRDHLFPMLQATATYVAVMLKISQFYQRAHTLIWQNIVHVIVVALLSLVWCIFHFILER